MIDVDIILKSEQKSPIHIYMIYDMFILNIPKN